MKKVILIWASFFFISCNNLENCEVEIVNGFVYKDKVLYTGKCAYYDYYTGNIVSSHEYNKGKFHGKWKFYFENGQLETVGKFDNGLRIGKWNYYYQTICDNKNECETIVSIANSFNDNNKYWKYILKKNKDNEYLCYTQLFIKDDLILEVIEKFNNNLLEEKIIPENKIQEEYMEK